MTLGGVAFGFKTLKLLFHRLLPSTIADKKSAVSKTITPPFQIILLLSLVVFKIFPFVHGVLKFCYYRPIDTDLFPCLGFIHLQTEVFSLCSVLESNIVSSPFFLFFLYPFSRH